MPIEFRCSQCQKLLRTGDETAGKQAKCPECGTVMEIPQSSTAGPSTPPAGSIPPTEPPSPFGAPPSQASQGVPPGDPFQSGPRPGGAAPSGVPPFVPGPGGPANPYQSPSGFVPGPSPSLVPQGEVQPTPIDIGDVMSRAWGIFKDRMGICIGAALIVGVYTNVPGFVDTVARYVEPKLIFEPAYWAVFIPFALAWSLPGLWLTIGQAILFLKVARGQPASIGDLFSGGPYFLTALLAAILLTVIVSIPILCGVAPGALLLVLGSGAYVPVLLVGVLCAAIPCVILGLMFSQWLYLIVDRRLDVVESLSVSRQVTSGNKLMLFLLALVLGIISVPATCCTCYIGLIFLLPYIQTVWVVVYLTMTGQPTVEQMQLQMPPGPQPVA